ncbi:hypothetical protein CPC08DRAFT_331546 [Agrocybe pediades]|nr:hypothetical protein CPC08DRAFT_331546 [Agrocybe pediades]
MAQKLSMIKIGDEIEEEADKVSEAESTKLRISKQKKMSIRRVRPRSLTAIPPEKLSMDGPWDFEALFKETEEAILEVLEELAIQPVSLESPLSLDILPDRFPDGEPHYKLLSILAIWSSPNKRLKLAEIGKAIMARFPWMKEERPSFYDSLRHNLSREPVFINIKGTAEPSATRKKIESVLDRNNSRGNDWQVDIRRLHHPKKRGLQPIYDPIPYPPQPSCAHSSKPPSEPPSLKNPRCIAYRRLSDGTWDSPKLHGLPL